MKPWMKTLLRRTAWTLGSTALAIVALYGIENVRGQRAWKAWLAERAAAGEVRDPRAFAPPEVPDEANFAKAPCVAPTLAPESQGLEELPSRKTLVGLDPKVAGDWREGRRMDFSALPLKDIDAALLSEADRLAAWTEAVRRPHCRLSERYDDHAMEIPALLGWRGITRVYRIRALVALHRGDGEKALGDVETGFRMVRHLEQEPLLIAQLLRMAQVSLMLQPVWEGLQDGRWNDAQLQRLQATLAEQDLLGPLRRAWTFERLITSQALQGLQQEDVEALLGSPHPNWLRLGRLLPLGWTQQNLVVYERTMLERCEMTLGPVGRRVQVAPELQMRTRHPYTFLAAIMLPALESQNRRAAQLQAALDLARVAVALERHRLSHRAYPAGLEALVPAYLPSLPHDLCTGEPLVYRLKPDGSYTLHARGFDRTDNGGTRSAKLQDAGAPGDWVWR